MNTYRVFSLEGKTLRFRGELIATVKSGQIETVRGSVWFELNAYEREPSHIVVTITAKRDDSEFDEVFDFYSAVDITAAEDFLYDFDPSVILPKDILAVPRPKRTSANVTVDHAYYAAARRLIRELSDHLARQQVPPTKTEPTARPTSPPDVTDHSQGKLVNRIRHLFGI